MMDEEKADNESAISTLEEKGMTIVKLTDDERAQWVAVADDMVDWSKNFVGADVYDAYMQAVDSVR
jgi:TRAP-type C4-dicarboxylate transport system substrate-binding protein